MILKSNGQELEVPKQSFKIVIPQNVVVVVVCSCNQKNG